LSIRILIVEDDRDALQVLKTLLEMEGYSVYCAEDGWQGFEAARREKPDLILTDIAMPKLDGIEMIKMLRAEPVCREIPVIVFTAFRGETTGEAKQAGANSVIYKPIEIDTLLNLIKNMG
jgi:CheY-like chemotaxis protein